MRITRESIGVTAGHATQPPTPVDAYTLDSGAGLAVTVWTYGATLVEVRVPDRRGRLDNVVLRLPDLTSYEDPAQVTYLGAVLGRYCRCVSEGRLRLDGVDHLLDRNDGRHHLHGGSLGFHRLVWKAEAERDRDTLALRLRLERPDGDQGYPGALSAEVTYRIDGDRRLVFECQATAAASTIVGLTSHAFWNLAGSGTVDAHRLALNATRALLFDAELIPLPGAPIPIAGTALDYLTPRPIGHGRLDNFFVLDDPSWAAELFDPAGGRLMRIRTDQLGLGVYSADGLPTPRTGLCLQASAWPDAPNRPDFPSIRLDPGDTYHHRTAHEFATG